MLHSALTLSIVAYALAQTHGIVCMQQVNSKKKTPSAAHVNQEKAIAQSLTRGASLQEAAMRREKIDNTNKKRELTRSSSFGTPKKN